VEHAGQELGRGTWPAILDEDTYKGVRAKLGDGLTPRRTNAHRVRLLLSGIARCGYPVDGGICGAPIKGAGSNASGRRYRCSTGRHITRLAKDLDQHVEDIVLRWLPTKDAVEVLTRGSEQASELHTRAAALRARLNGLGEAFAAGEIDREQLRSGTERGKADLAKVEKQLKMLTAESALSGIAGHADAAQRWADLTIDRQRAVIDAVWSVTLNPGKRGGHGGTRFDPATVSVTRKARTDAV
jgi:site-specific DNA recombinase